MESIIGLPNADFHEDIDKALSDSSNRKIVVTLPRGHGKSTHISVGFPLWLIAKNHNLRILLVSSTSTISKSFMTEIISHIERNEAYQNFAKYAEKSGLGVIPKMKNYRKAQENWSGDSIIIDRQFLNLKDPTIHAVGLFGSILSKRADIIICDDIVNQENSQTEEQRKKVIDWIYTTVMPVLAPGGRFMYLGNTWHQDDLVSHLLKDPQFDFKKKLPAIQSWSERPDLWKEWSAIVTDEELPTDERKLRASAFYQQNEAGLMQGVKLLWPGRFTYAELYLEWLANPYSFARMRQCDPTNRPDQKFRDEWLEAACRKGSKMKLQDMERPEFILDMAASGVDLAIGTEEYNDDTVILTLDKVKHGSGEIKAGDYVVRQIVVGKLSPNETREGIKHVYNHMKPLGIRVESVGYQEAIIRDLEHEVTNIHGYHTGGEKHDPAIGVNSLAIIAEQGKLILPYDLEDRRTIQIISRLMNEMRAFPDGHTGDILMALWFAQSEIRDLSGGRTFVPSAYGSTGKGVETVADIKDPVRRAAEEKKADLTVAQRLERQHELDTFKRMMRRGR
jgi:hypothetical protein